LALASLIIGAH